MGHDTYTTGGYNPGNLADLPIRPGSRGLDADQVILKQRVIAEARAILAADPFILPDTAFQRAVVTVTKSPLYDAGIVRARDVAAVLPPSPMAVRAIDEAGWHRVSRAVRDGFLATCGDTVALHATGAIDAWADIADEGTSYCTECAAIDAGEWTQHRFPTGTAVAYVIEQRTAEWQTRAHRLRVALGIRHPR